MAGEAERPQPESTSATLARARKLVPQPPPGNAIADLAADYPPAEVASRRGLPLATVLGIRSFYEQLEHRARVCAGTACHFAGAAALRERLEGLGPVGEVRCLGHCYAAPTFRSGDKIYSRPANETVDAWLDEWGEGPSPMVDLHPVPRTCLAAEPATLRRLLPGAERDPWSEYALPDGEAILRALEAADVRGRGSAAVPTADKWRAARGVAAPDRVVIANGDEGDPGAYVDRMLLEEDPHAVLAGLVACARAIGAHRGIVFVRAEYPRALRAVRAAVAAGRERGVFGDLAIEVVAGAGSYVSGEETALLRSIEGLRGEPVPRPPYLTERGLGGLPTVVQSVEALALVPWIVRNGRAAGTKAVCIAGAVQRPGVVEVPLGMSVFEVLARGAGGPLPERPWGMALIGGPLGRVLPATKFGTPLSYEALPGMGHGGLIVLGDDVRPREVAAHLFAFARSESCGSCLPCRAASARLADATDRAGLERLLRTMELGSLCDFGHGVPRPLRDLLAHYRNEVLA